MLSHKSRYALKASILLAREFGQGPVLISEIARRERIPPKFLEGILLELRHSGILQSRKGKGGGYSLARDPARVTLAQVLRVVEGSLAPSPCADRTAAIHCPECIDEDNCVVRMVMQDLHDATDGIIESTSLADVLHRITGKLGAEGRPKVPSEKNFRI
jgi:Rrf2 family protein